MELKVLKLYINRSVKYTAGSVINVTAGEAAFLLRDAPGCFEEVKPEAALEEKQIEEAPADKMIRRARKDK